MRAFVFRTTHHPPPPTAYSVKYEYRRLRTSPLRPPRPGAGGVKYTSPAYSIADAGSGRTLKTTEHSLQPTRHSGGPAGSPTPRGARPGSKAVGLIPYGFIYEGGETSNHPIGYTTILGSAPWVPIGTLGLQVLQVWPSVSLAYRIAYIQVWFQCKFDPNCISMQSAIKVLRCHQCKFAEFR